MSTLPTPWRAALACAAASLISLAAPARAATPIEHWTQPSGARVWFIPSPSIPMLDVHIDFDAGSRRDPAAQAGLADATALMAGKGVQAQGSAPALDENELGQAWADLGASFGASASADRMSFDLRTLTDAELLPQAIALAARQIAHPAWPEAVWQRERERISAALKEARTRPGVVADLAFNHAVYGPHPYGYETTADTLARISVADMRALYARSIAPCRAKVSLVGAISRQQADALVTQLLAQLPADPGHCAALPPVPDVPPLAAPVSQWLPFESAQAHVLIGQPGYSRQDPDFFPLLVGNHILGGGGFTSRLMTQVREKRGLSYSVYSAFNPGLHAGAFHVGLQTKPEQAHQAVEVAQAEIARFVQQGPSAAELKAAKDNLIGSFPLRLDGNRKLLAQVANIAWNDLPLDYLHTWPSRIQAVSAAQIRQAFARVLHPDRMVTVVVGASAPSPAASAAAPR